MTTSMFRASDLPEGARQTSRIAAIRDATPSGRGSPRQGCSRRAATNGNEKRDLQFPRKRSVRARRRCARAIRAETPHSLRCARNGRRGNLQTRRGRVPRCLRNRGVRHWDKLVQELIQAGWADPYALVDLPLGLLRTVCDRLVEMGQSDATGLELDPQDLAAIEEAGASMACSRSNCTKPIRHIVLAPVERRAPVGRAAPCRGSTT